MKPGDHVKIIGKDGFYIFLKDVQGTATVQAGSAENRGETMLDIPVRLVVSLERNE
jgi:hypothetical protein